MIEIEEFRGANGHVDWQAFHAAKVKAGERCGRCAVFILFPSGHEDTCGECKAMEAPGEMDHGRLLRCPHCQTTFNAL